MTPFPNRRRRDSSSPGLSVATAAASRRASMGLCLALVGCGHPLPTLAQVVPAPANPLSVACAYNTTPPALSNTNAGWIQCDSLGRLLTSNSGSTGIDASANKPLLPNVGANFGATGPFANFALIGTIPAGPKTPRVQNLSTCSVLVVQDDGTAASGAQPVNASIWVLNPAPASGMGGSGYSSPTDKGRDQVYTAPACASTNLITIHTD